MEIFENEEEVNESKEENKDSDEENASEKMKENFAAKEDNRVVAKITTPYKIYIDRCSFARRI